MKTNSRISALIVSMMLATPPVLAQGFFKKKPDPAPALATEAAPSPAPVAAASTPAAPVETAKVLPKPASAASASTPAASTAVKKVEKAVSVKAKDQKVTKPAVPKAPKYVYTHGTPAPAQVTVPAPVVVVASQASITHLEGLSAILSIPTSVMSKAPAN